MSNRDIAALIEQIRETITMRSEGSLSLPRTREAYRTLLRQYNLVEQKYISNHSLGHIKGLLYHHNNHNSANLTALFLASGNDPVPLVFAGDRVLLNALPELINREAPALRDEGTYRVRLGDKGGQTFSLVLKKLAVSRETIILASVTSSTLFDTALFDYCADLMRSLYARCLELRSPVMMIYINNIASEITRIFRSLDAGALHADLYMLKIPRGSFLHAGMYTLNEFSSFIVDTLKAQYPESVSIFVLSLASYLVLYGDETKNGLDLKPSRLNFIFHGNNIPFKVDRSAIDSPQSLYLFLEKL